MKQTFSILSAALIASTLSAVSMAAPRTDSDNAGNRNDRDSNALRNSSSDSDDSQAFLGVAVTSLDDALRSHLRNQISDGSGVLVADVADGSPAAKSGLRQHDILVSLDDQRLYSPEQLVRLVESEKPGRVVKLHVIRNGKSENLEAKLGSHQMASATQSRRAYSWPMSNQQQGRQDQQGNQNQRERQDNQWQSFDAMTLSRVDKNNFKAEIRYRDDRGNIESHHFQGTPDQLRHDIDGQKDLPYAERNRLLRALDVANNPGDVEFQEFHLSNDRN